jgi:hypothetical protein
MPCTITDLYSTSVLRIDGSSNLIIGAVGSPETSVAVYHMRKSEYLTAHLKKKNNVLSVTFPAVLQNLGNTVAQLVEALCYKPEGRMFDFRWCNWKFSLT